MLLCFTCFDLRSPTPHRISNNNSEASITVAEPTQRLQTQQLNHKLVEHAHMFTPAHVALKRRIIMVSGWSLDISGGVLFLLLIFDVVDVAIVSFAMPQYAAN